MYIFLFPNQPSDSVVHPVYNPVPGPWFAVAYLEKEDGTDGTDGDGGNSLTSWLGGRVSSYLHRRCRYSVGSIALWSKSGGGSTGGGGVDSVDIVIPGHRNRFRTSRRLHYYRFHVQV